MRLFSLTFFLLPLLTACSSLTPLPPTSVSVAPTQTIASFSSSATLSREWIGAGTKPDGSTASIIISFGESETKLTIEPMTRTWEVNVSQENEVVAFSATSGTLDPFKQIDFLGTFSGEAFAGELNWDGQTSSITFIPITSVEPSVLAKYEGIYRFASGRVLSIIVRSAFSTGGLQIFSQSLTMTDFESGALRGLYPLNDYTFAVGALRAVGAPFAGRIQFILDDQRHTTGLLWWDEVSHITPSTMSGQFAERVPYKYEDITFTSKDGTKLAGRISLPESNSPLPAFVMLHGSGRVTRDNFGNKLMAHYMMSRGIAILNYDKRGVGESEGVYQESASVSNLQKLAEDALAGVKYLTTRREIDAKRIGLIGGSQAGWIIPSAASQSQQVSYFVILSGPVASTAHESRFSAYTSDGESVSEYDDTKITQQMRGLRAGGFDPVPIIVELEQPGLWLWGSVDKSIPVTFSAENLEALIDSGKNNFSYQIFPNADHGLTSSSHGLIAEIPYSPGLVFYPDLTKWLVNNVLRTH
jgi:uncharacterized protein